MGFNIGRFIGSIAPAIGGAFGPIGGALGTGVSAALADDPQPVAAATVGRATQPGPVSIRLGGFDRQFQGGTPFLPTSVGPTAARAIPNLLGRGAGALSLFDGVFGNGNGNGKSPMSRILARARAATGGPVTRNKIIDAAKTCGLEIAADTFGLSVTEVCQVVVKGRTRRRRGVSAADIRRTKRTIGFASRIRKDLKALAR